MYILWPVNCLFTAKNIKSSFLGRLIQVPILCFFVCELSLYSFAKDIKSSFLLH